MSYDSKCHDLAETFLTDAGITDPEAVAALAQRIQDTIEDTINDLLAQPRTQ